MGAGEWSPLAGTSEAEMYFFYFSDSSLAVSHGIVRPGYSYLAPFSITSSVGFANVSEKEWIS